MSIILTFCLLNWSDEFSVSVIHRSDPSLRSFRLSSTSSLGFECIVQTLSSTDCSKRDTMRRRRLIQESEGTSP